MLSMVGAEGAHTAPERVRVVVGAQPGEARPAERLVRRLGGDVGQRLAIVDGFTARVPAAAIARLRRAAPVRTVARDVALTLSSVAPVEYDALAGSADDAPASTGSTGSTGSSTTVAQPPALAIDPPPAEIPADEPADEVARDAIAAAAEDAVVGASLAPDPVASGEDGVAAVQDAVADPVAPVEPSIDDGPARARASMDLIRASAGAHGGLTGAGIDVALIDSGVLGVDPLDGPASSCAAPTSPTTPTMPTCAASTRSATDRTWPA